MSSLKSTLPLFQTSSLSSSSSTSFINTYVPQTSTNNNNNHTSFSYRSNSALYPDSNNIGNSSYPMSSSTYRSSLSSSPFTILKPSAFQQTREKEKFELSTLNDKFADYVEKVRYLEAQNKKVQMETNFISDKQQANCQHIKTMFETEMAQLKEIVEKLFKDKNTLNYAAKDAQVSLD
jgi:hypothetical protein